MFLDVKETGALSHHFTPHRIEEKTLQLWRRHCQEGPCLGCLNPAGPAMEDLSMPVGLGFRVEAWFKQQNHGLTNKETRIVYSKWIQTIDLMLKNYMYFELF